MREIRLEVVVGLATDRALNRRRNSPATGARLALEALQLRVCHVRHDKWSGRNAAAHLGRPSSPSRQAVVPAAEGLAAVALGCSGTQLSRPIRAA